MKSKFSLTIGALIALNVPNLISIANEVFHTGFSSECVGNVWDNLWVVGTSAVAWIGRVRVGDINPLGVRRNSGQ